MTDELRPGDVGIIERVYYAVPSHYTIGDEFPGNPEGHTAAVAAAKASIKRFVYFEGQPSERESYSRAFIDLRYTIRWLPGAEQIGSGIDKSVERIEIFLTEEEKAALRDN